MPAAKSARAFLAGLHLLALTAGPASLGCRSLAAPAPPSSVDPEAAATAADAAEDAAAATAPEDADSGMRNLAELLRRLRQAEAGRSFRAAARLLLRVQRGAAEATPLTRAHPDFEDVQLSVRAAAGELAAAVEADRIERRTAAIDLLMARGNRAMQQNGTLVTELSGRAPLAADASNLAEATALFAELQAAGTDYGDAPRYLAHAQIRDAFAQQLQVGANRAQLQLQLSDDLRPSLEAAVAGAREAGSTDLATLSQGLQRAAAAFAACSQRLAAATAQPNYRADLLLETPLGALSIERTAHTCTVAGEQARARLARLAWETAMNQQVALLQTAQAGREAATQPTDKVAAEEAFLAAAQACAANAPLIRDQAGYDAEIMFPTPLGNLTAPELLPACANAASEAQLAVPRLRWLAAVRTFTGRIAQLDAQLRQAAAPARPEVQAQNLSTLLGGLQECSERADLLLHAAAAEPQATFPTALGTLRLEALWRRCQRERLQAQQQLSVALGASQTEAFLVTCQADEVAVVQRLGRPQQLEIRATGRTFYFTASADGSRLAGRYDFDVAGHRIDLELQWRQAVQARLADLADLNSARATTAGSLVLATEDASPAQGRVDDDAAAAAAAGRVRLPQLDACEAAPELYPASPGFDAEVSFDSLWGSLNAVALRNRCRGEAQRLRLRLPQLAWAAQLERAVATARAALAQMEDLPMAAAAAPARLQAAQDGLSTCRDLATALLHAPGVVRSLRLASPFGRVSVRELQTQCRQAAAALARRQAASVPAPGLTGAP